MNNLQKKLWSNELKEIAIRLEVLKMISEDKSKLKMDKDPFVIDYKRELRSIIKRYAERNEFESCFSTIYHDYESHTDVYLIPRAESETRQDFEDWFWECRARSVREYDYSPTGLLFTSGVKFAKQTLPDGRLVWRVHETLTRDV